MKQRTRYYSKGIGILMLYGLLANPLTAMTVQHPRLPDRPNILLAIADDWSYGHAGAYGCSWVKNFYQRYLKGEKIPAGWVNPGDFEKEPLNR